MDDTTLEAAMRHTDDSFATLAEELQSLREEVEFLRERIERLEGERKTLGADSKSRRLRINLNE